MNSTPQSWYPMCLSGDLKPGTRRIVRAFEADWIVFRSESGAAGVLRSTCPHGGVDLRTGSVQDGHMVCPMHGWRFGTDGHGWHPEQREECLRIKHLQVEEHLGVLHAFFGDGEAFPFPKRLPQEKALHTRASRFDFATPYQMVGMNAFDTRHLWPVHRRKPTAPPVVQSHSATHISIHYHAAVAGDHLRDRLLRWSGLREIEVEVHSYGGSVLVFEHRKVGVYTYLSMMPRGDAGVSVFMAACRERTGHPLEDLLKRALLGVQGTLMRTFAMEDLEVLRHARFSTENLDPVLDETPIRWLDHYQALPRRKALAG